MKTLPARVMTTFILLTGCAVLLTGCGAGPQSGKGFTLPEGDAAAGADTFVNLQCNSCHHIIGNDDITHPDDAEISVALGGKVLRIETYGQLVTSIINPSHRLAAGYLEESIAENGESKMRNYNSLMTVQELIDLVTFLQDQYELLPYQVTNYPMYYPSIP